MDNEKELPASALSKSGSDDEKAKPSDVVLVQGRTDDGEGIRVLRAREGNVEVGELRAMRPGMPLLSGDVVALTQRAEHPRLWNVDVQYRVEGNKQHSGPAKFASHAYRENWDVVFRRDGPAMSADDKSMLN